MLAVPFLVYFWPTEAIRRMLTAAYHLQAYLPPAMAKKWRLFTTLCFQAIPALRPGSGLYGAKSYR